MTDAIDRLTTALAGRYRLERELGAGGMATVYLAQDLKHMSVDYYHLFRHGTAPDWFLPITVGVEF